MSFDAPTVTEFKAYFTRGFPYGTGAESVRDADIQKALSEVPPLSNPTLWADTTEHDQAWLYAAAHFLVLDIQMGGGLGKNGGVLSTGSAPINQKSVGQVSVSYAISDRVKNDPILSQFLQTSYGQRYLQMLSPRLVGNIALVSGRAPWTNA